MNKFMKVTLLLAFAVVSFGAYRYGAAQERGARRGLIPIEPPTFDVQISQDSEALAINHVLQRTYTNSGIYGSFVPGETLTPIDARLTVVCPGTSGTCTIEADMWAQSTGSSSGNANAVCLYVDGNATNGCPLTGETPSDTSFVVNSFSQSVKGVAHGNHTVQTYYFSSNGAGVESYTSHYRVYKP